MGHLPTTKYFSYPSRLAEKKKEAGNNAYSAKDYKLAVKFYSEAIGMYFYLEMILFKINDLRLN